VQNQHESNFEHRVHVYNYRAEDVYSSQYHLRRAGDENPNWRPSEYVYEEDGCVRILRWPSSSSWTTRSASTRSRRSAPVHAPVVAHLVPSARAERGRAARRGTAVLRGLLTRNLMGRTCAVDALHRLAACATGSHEEEVTRQFHASAGENTCLTYELGTDGIEKGKIEGMIEELHQTIALALKIQFPA